nr:MAG TPA: hypothetical protein [Caudoviricetes sp.]
MNRQSTLKLEFAIRTGRSHSAASLCTTKPYSKFIFAAFHSFKFLILIMSIVRCKLQGVQRLNARNIGLHFIRQGCGFQHLRSAAEIRKILNIDQLLISAGLLLHKKNLIGVNCHLNLPPVNCFIFRDDRSIPCNHSINRSVLLIGNRIHKGSCETECFHLCINESDNCFTFSFLAARFVGVDIHLVKHLCVIFDSPGIPGVSINLIVCLYKRDAREGRWRLDVFASHIDFWVFRSCRFRHDIEYL